ncbi:MAG TPA: adenosylhomocysteinase [Nitrospirota bacterium]|nr:adenosylhomocysteinase [Nitrospirota bacterium]
MACPSKVRTSRSTTATKRAVIIHAQESQEAQEAVYGVPQNIDTEIARLKLNAMGVRIDKLTPEQKKYLASWEMGT